MVVNGNLVAGGDFSVGQGTIMGGSIDGRRNVKLNEKFTVGFALVSGGNVEMFESSEVAKNIYAQGVIKVLKQPKIGFPSSVASDSVNLFVIR